MKVRILGTGGSLPSTNPETFKYGGNTACIEVIENDQMLILDAGTGVLKIAQDVKASQTRFDILLTHLHIDHIQGLGFFKPLFDSKNEVHIWGPSSSTRSLHNKLNRYLSPPLFPVHFRNLPCKIELHELTRSTFEIGGLQFSSAYINHPGPTIGYRISNSKSIFTYLPDHEPFLGNRGLNIDKKWISGMGLAENADLLIHDSQYTPKEYLDRIGWGHSSIEQAVRFATIAEVKKLLLFHHDPNHTDSQLDYIFRPYIDDNSFEFDIEPAAEGRVFDLS
jgi:phosphoribosyl 1,2-cyclic phosphodiesterase